MGKRIIRLAAHDGLLNLLRGNARIVSGLPTDARLRNVSYDADRDAIALLVESPVWLPPVHTFGEPIPVQEVLLEAKSGYERWREDRARLEGIAARAAAALPVAPRVPGVGTEILYVEFNDADEDATATVIANLAARCEGVAAYVQLESPLMAEHVAVADLKTGPYVRLVRSFHPFPREGAPRMVTCLHVGVVRDGA